MRGSVLGALRVSLYSVRRYSEPAGPPGPVGRQLYRGYRCTHVWPHQFPDPPNCPVDGCDESQITTTLFFVRVLCANARCTDVFYYAIKDAAEGMQHRLLGHRPAPFRIGDL